MKRLVFVLTITVISLFSQAQNRTLKEVLTLKMPLTVDDDMPGTRGANVVWHPVQKKYYASFAGNMGYPLGIFDVKGTRVSGDDQKCMEDLRGLWYDPIAKEIQGNGYNDHGWFKYILDAKGLVSDFQTIFEGMNQPDAQSVGAYDAKNKKVLFIFDGKLHIYDPKTATEEAAADINWGKTGSSSSGGDLANYDSDEYNTSTIIYTGIAGAEIGFLNVTKKQIELYNYTTYNLARVLSLPEDAITETTFNFAFANGIYWLFDMEGRTWHGYR